MSENFSSGTKNSKQTNKQKKKYTVLKEYFFDWLHNSKFRIMQKKRLTRNNLFLHLKETFQSAIYGKIINAIYWSQQFILSVLTSKKYTCMIVLIGDLTQLEDALSKIGGI